MSFVWPIDRTLGQSGYGSNGKWKGTLHSPKLQYYWNLTIRLFSVISRTLVRGVLPLCREAVGVLYSPSQMGKLFCSTLFTRLHTLKKIITYFFLTRRCNPIIYYLTGSEWTWKWRGSPHSPALQDLSLTIRLFSDISRTLIRWSYPSVEMHSAYSKSPVNWIYVSLELQLCNHTIVLIWQ